jgi:hypothetical protein
LKVSVLPTEVGACLEHATRTATRGEFEIAAIGRAALGVLYLKVDLSREAPAEAGAHIGDVVRALRADAVARKGSAVVIAAPADLGAELDVWGDIGSGLPVMRAVKARFDPRGTLCDRFGF